jgi:heat shock protein HslJ
MKKKWFICGISALLIGMVSCKSQPKEASPGSEALATADNSRNVLDWDGLYSGILPCADCGGIQTSLELSRDNTYKLKQVYLGKEENRFDGSGKFEWNKNGNIITLDNGEGMNQYLVGEQELIMLDTEGNRITGEGAGNYVLAKVDKGLVEKYWKLTELFGEPVYMPEGRKEAHLIFRQEGNRVNGNGGCNGFSGTYTLKPGNRIRFSQVVSTMMICPDMKTETKLSQVFEMADHYAVNGDSLVLNRASMPPLARFVAVK